MNQISNVSAAPIMVVGEGKNASERKLSVVRDASTAALAALAGAKGNVGKLARAGIVKSGLVSIAQHCANANYRPVAELVAATAGKAVVITSRASYEALTDTLDAWIAEAKLSKTGGMKEDKKTGILVAGPKLAMLMGLRHDVVNIQQAAEQMRAQREAERAERATLEAAATADTAS